MSTRLTAERKAAIIELYDTTGVDFSALTYDQAIVVELLDELDAVTRERDEARNLAYVPGDWICPQCGFVQSMRTMSAVDGSVWVSNNPALPCPNDGEFMQRLPWKQRAEDLREIATPDIRLLDDLDAFLRECAKLMPDANLGISLLATSLVGTPAEKDGPYVVQATVIGPEDTFTEHTAREALRAALESQRA